MPPGKIRNQRNTIRTTYGIYVGIDNYRLSGFPSLKGCVRDAKRMCTAFNANQSTVLLDEDATRKNILGLIEKHIKTLEKRDLLILTISAHGTLMHNDIAIAPYDAEGDNRLGTFLSMYHVVTALSEIAKNAGKVLLILDACHIGAMNFDIAKYSGILAQGGISCISSCGPKEYAKELSFEGNTQGVFTKYIFDGLEGSADPDNSGIITLRNLYDYAYKKVCGKVEGQHPLLIGTLEGNTVLKVLDHVSSQSNTR